MSKNREAVTCNGRAAFYAAMWDDIRQCAMDCGWAVALHGSLRSDMDIMAMPWVQEADSFEELIREIVKLFHGNHLAEGFRITYDEKPWGVQQNVPNPWRRLPLARWYVGRRGLKRPQCPCVGMAVPTRTAERSDIS